MSELTDFDAVLFDLDGVITPTAGVHLRAWTRMFNEFLDRQGVQPPFSDRDYFDHVDGRPRYDGVRAFLTARGIELPEGTPDDSPNAGTVCGLGNRKDDLFNRILLEEGVEAYPGSVRLLETLRVRGIPMAVVSSSRNAPAVLAAAGMTNYFQTVIDGSVAAARSLAGKPAPDTFVAAAHDLAVTPDRAAVVEDAISGVAAGAAGGFGCVVGVDRGVGAVALTEAGADLVVNDLEDLLS
jgi:beta-phosphoglucomutase family hydrolase